MLASIHNCYIRYKRNRFTTVNSTEWKYGMHMVNAINTYTHKRVGEYYPDSKVDVANMGPTRVLSVPNGPYVGPMNLSAYF